MCFGTMTFGGDSDEAASTALFARCRDPGSNFFDTADIYTNGRSEEILGRLMADSRDELVVATKFAGPRVRAKGDRAMQASDVMTTNVVTVSPETRVEQIARLLLEQRISGVPVIDADGRLVGIVTESDLMRRPELGTERHRGWWLRLFGDYREQAAEYARAHGSRADEVMTRNVITVTEATPVGEIARLLEQHRVKRVPVVRGGTVVGIVSRANLLHSLAARPAPTPPERWMDDRSIRDEVLRVLTREGVTAHGPLNVTVTNGVAELWGLVESEEERRAIRVAVENIPSVVAVKDNLGRVRPWLWGA